MLRIKRISMYSISCTMPLLKRLKSAGYHGDREADSDHDDVMQDHEELPPEVAEERCAHVFGRGHRLLVTLDPQLVPVAHEHGVDVVHKVGHSEQDIAAGQPVPGHEGWNRVRRVKALNTLTWLQKAPRDGSPQFKGHYKSLWPSPISLPLTKTLALSALSCKSPPELASIQGLILSKGEHSPLLH